MCPENRTVLRRELRSIRRWLVVIAILVAGVFLGTQSDLNSGPTVLFAPLMVIVVGTLIGGPIYLAVSLLRVPPGTDDPSRSE